MIGIRLTASKGDEQLISFLLSELDGMAYRIMKNEGKSFTVIRFSSEEENFHDRFYSVLAKGVRLFYKYEFLSRNVRRFTSEPRHQALLGAMLGVDVDSEERYILGTFAGEPNVSLPQLKHFKLERLFEEWQAFADFVDAFFREDWDGKRAFFEVIPVLQILALGDERQKNETGISLNGETGELFEGERRITVMRFTDNTDYNLLTMITAVKPDVITITNPKRLSSEIVDVLKEMGQAEKMR